MIQQRSCGAGRAGPSSGASRYIQREYNLAAQLWEAGSAVDLRRRQRF
jgi:hypothetical protein